MRQPLAPKSRHIPTESFVYRLRLFWRRCKDMYIGLPRYDAPHLIWYIVISSLTGRSLRMG